MEILKYPLIFILVPILIPVLISLKSKTTTKVLVILLSLIIASSIIPLHPVQGDPSNLNSIFDLINSGNREFIVMLGSYFISLILLAVPGHKLNKASLGIYLVGYIAFWMGLSSQLNGQFPVYPSSKFGNIIWLASLIWFLLYVLVPLVNFLFFIPLVTSEKYKKEAIQQVIRRQRKAAKIPFQDQLSLLKLTVSLLLIYVVGATYFYNKFHCPMPQDCTIWGGFFSRSGLFWISGCFLFIDITIAMGKGVLKEEAKVARYLIPVVFLLFLAGNYISFQTFVKTNEQGLESKDLLNYFKDGTKTVSLSWGQIKSFGFEANKVHGRCKVSYSYLILQDGSKAPLSTVVNSDNNFFDFLVNQKGISLQKPLKCD